jgi:hypothetical protein
MERITPDPLRQITGWDGDWDYYEEDSPTARKLTLKDRCVLDKDGATVGSYAVDEDRLTITFEPVGDAVSDRLEATRADNLDIANGYRAYGFADDVPESEGGSGPLTVIVRLLRIRPD